MPKDMFVMVQGLCAMGRGESMLRSISSVQACFVGDEDWIR